MEKKTKCDFPCRKTTKAIVGVLFIVAIIVVGFSLFIVFQENPDKSKFIGAWKSTYLSIETTWTFYGNDTVKLVYIDTYDDVEDTTWGNYNVEDGKLYLGSSMCYDYEFSNSDTRLTVTRCEYPSSTPMTFIKVS